MGGGSTNRGLATFKLKMHGGGGDGRDTKGRGRGRYVERIHGWETFITDLRDIFCAQSDNRT